MPDLPHNRIPPRAKQRRRSTSAMIAAEKAQAKAAAQANVHKSSIIRAIRSGRIRASRNEFGDWRIAPEELNRYLNRHEPPPQRGRTAARARANPAIRIAE
jgi:hypothetical protein